MGAHPVSPNAWWAAIGESRTNALVRDSSGRLGVPARCGVRSFTRTAEGWCHRMNWWDAVIAIIGGIVLVYAVLLTLLALYARKHPDTVGMRDALRLLPDLLVLLRRLTADRTLSGGLRVRLVLLLAYLASPIDLVPDFLPVIGYADDAIIVALVLRSVIRKAGHAPLERHWPGTPAGLTLIRRLAGMSPTNT